MTEAVQMELIKGAVTVLIATIGLCGSGVAVIVLWLKLRTMQQQVTATSVQVSATSVQVDKVSEQTLVNRATTVKEAAVLAAKTENTAKTLAAKTEESTKAITAVLNNGISSNLSEISSRIDSNTQAITDLQVRVNQHTALLQTHLDAGGQLVPALLTRPASDTPDKVEIVKVSPEAAQTIKTATTDVKKDGAA